MNGEYDDVHGAALRDLARRFGGYLGPKLTQAIGAGAGVPVQALQADPERVFVLFVNTGVGVISISPFGSILTTGGISISPGSDRSFNVNDHGSLPTEPWWMLAGVGDNLTILIVRRETLVKP
jgi:hypothetical protein